MLNLNPIKYYFDKEFIKYYIITIVAGSFIILLFYSYHNIMGNQEQASWSGIMELSLFPISAGFTFMLQVVIKTINFKKAQKKYIDYLISISND